MITAPRTIARSTRMRRALTPLCFTGGWTTVTTRLGYTLCSQWYACYASLRLRCGRERRAAQDKLCFFVSDTDAKVNPVGYMEGRVSGRTVSKLRGLVC